MAGWITLHRKIQDHWIWDDPVKLKWWIDMILEANHADGVINIGVQLIECKRGQSAKSLQTWAKRWKVSKSAVRNFFDLLKKDGMIDTENITVTTRVTIIKYDDYQCDVHAPKTQEKRKKNAPKTQEDPNNNDNNTINYIVDTNVSTMSNEKSHPTNNLIDFEKLVDYFNQKTNGVFGVVRYPISEERKGMIRARIREHGKEAFIEMIEKAMGSNFLKGDNRSGFRAKFDWLIKPSNFQKVIEGNYNNSVTHNDSLLTYDQVSLMVQKGELTFDMLSKVQGDNGKLYYKRK